MTIIEHPFYLGSTKVLCLLKRPSVAKRANLTEALHNRSVERLSNINDLLPFRSQINKLNQNLNGKGRSGVIFLDPLRKALSCFQFLFPPSPHHRSPGPACLPVLFGSPQEAIIRLGRPCFLCILHEMHFRDYIRIRKCLLSPKSLSSRGNVLS